MPDMSNVLGSFLVEYRQYSKLIEVTDNDTDEVLCFELEEAKTIATEILRVVGIVESGGKQIKGFYVNFENPGVSNDEKS